MSKATSRKHSHESDFDVYGDLAKIKTMLKKTTLDARGRAGEILANSIEDVREKGILAQKNVTHYIAEKPLKSVGFAVLTGVILGYFLHRK
ncbi:MAG: hypothetical protein ACD_60C00126G0003 [uncultured bacterium]|nr:MAG: hypothetical protein ACD_60C00126G0003 [uncultured bacterium]